VADCGGGCGGKGLSLPHISLPKISLPKVHLPKLVHTTSSEYVLKTKHHFSLVKGGGHGGCNTCGGAAPVAASPQASGQH
jgi:hypothetical protein